MCGTIDCIRGTIDCVRGTDKPMRVQQASTSHRPSGKWTSYSVSGSDVATCRHSIPRVTVNSLDIVILFYSVSASLPGAGCVLPECAQRASMAKNSPLTWKRQTSASRPSEQYTRRQRVAESRAAGPTSLHEPPRAFASSSPEPDAMSQERRDFCPGCSKRNNNNNKKNALGRFLSRWRIYFHFIQAGRACAAVERCGTEPPPSGLQPERRDAVSPGRQRVFI